ncbi:MAG TPA: hypothetical protein VF471_06445 [Pseudoxanthomonas sp.]
MRAYKAGPAAIPLVGDLSPGVLFMNTRANHDPQIGGDEEE